MPIEIEIDCPFCGKEKLSWNQHKCTETGNEVNYLDMLAFKIMELEGKECCTKPAEEPKEVTLEELEEELEELDEEKEEEKGEPLREEDAAPKEEIVKIEEKEEEAPIEKIEETPQAEPVKLDTPLVPAEDKPEGE